MEPVDFLKLRRKLRSRRLACDAIGLLISAALQSPAHPQE